jgi:GDSL-like Lipase/Acylhydrolase family
MSKLRMSVAGLLSLLALLVVAVPATWADEYTSLGDSYTAGPLIPNPLSPLGCLKSSNNYPHLVARARALTLSDASCSGATTDDMTAPQNVTPGPNPPQFDSLAAGTDVVSLGIGGNDIGFTSILEDCVAIWPFGSPCKDQYTAGGRDQISDRINATAPKVAAVLAGIRARSPGARVFVVNYAAIFPESGSGCWPQMPVAFGDVPYLRAKQQELNRMLATQAAAAGARVVDWYRASIGHDACRSSSVRWVEPLVPGNAAAPVHPNLNGMRGAAAVLSAAF